MTGIGFGKGSPNTHRESGEAKCADASTSAPVNRKAAKPQCLLADGVELKLAFMVALIGNDKFFGYNEVKALSSEDDPKVREMFLEKLGAVADLLSEFALGQ